MILIIKDYLEFIIIVISLISTLYNIIQVAKTKLIAHTAYVQSTKNTVILAEIKNHTNAMVIALQKSSKEQGYASGVADEKAKNA